MRLMVKVTQVGCKLKVSSKEYTKTDSLRAAINECVKLPWRVKKVDAVSYSHP